jgi:hypothetical protein
MSREEDPEDEEKKQKTQATAQQPQEEFVSPEAVPSHAENEEPKAPPKQDQKHSG